MPSTTTLSSVVGRPERCVVDHRARYSIDRCLDLSVRRFRSTGPHGMELATYYRDIVIEAVVLSCPCSVHRAQPLPQKTVLSGNRERLRYTIITPERRARIGVLLSALDTAVAADTARFVDPRNHDELSPESRAAETALLQALHGIVSERPRHDAADTPATAKATRMLTDLGLDPLAARAAGVLLDNLYAHHFDRSALFGMPNSDPREVAQILLDSLRVRTEAAQRKDRSFTPSRATLQLIAMDLGEVADVIVRAREDIRRADPDRWADIEADCRAALQTSLEAMLYTDDGHMIDLEPSATPVTMPRTVSTSAAALDPDRIHFGSIVDAGTGPDEPYRAMFMLLARHLEAGTTEVLDWAQWVTAGGTRAGDTTFAHWLRAGQCTKRALGESKSAKIVRAAARDHDPDTLRVIVSCTRALIITLELEPTLHRALRRHRP